MQQVESKGLLALLEFVSENWEFNEQNYPGWNKLSSSEQQTFALKHILLHMTKSMGAMAIVLEPNEHGESISLPEDAQLAITKMLVNVLQLANKAGISATMLAGGVQVWGDKHKGLNA